MENFNLSVQNFSVSFPLQKETLHAVRNISFHVSQGEAVGIIGESGSGKTAMIQAITGLSPRSHVFGSVQFEGKDLLKSGHSVLGTRIGMVFQDPMTSLNPTMRIQDQIEEGLLYHKLCSKKEARERSQKLLHLVGMPDPAFKAKRYPHELSGGQRQRAAIAIALASFPSLLIADEPTTALDSATQDQIIRLLRDLQKELKISLILISHDFHVLSKICGRILVFYAGKIVEEGSIEDIFQHPKHPYTQMLLKARPDPDHPKNKPLYVIEGTAPRLTNIPAGCSFANRCPHVTEACKEDPPFVKSVACWNVSC